MYTTAAVRLISLHAYSAGVKDNMFFLQISKEEEELT